MMTSRYTMSLFLILPRARHFHILTVIMHMNNAVKHKFAKDVISKINECLSKCAQTLFGKFPDYTFLLLNYLIALFCSRGNLDLQQVCLFKEGLADLLQV